MKKVAILFVMFMFCFSVSEAKWHVDKQYKCKIQVPDNWAASSYVDGTDKVYDFYSPDENIAIQLRAFDAGTEVTIDLLVQVYEESMLPAGYKKLGLNDHTSKNGIPGKQGMYSAAYNGNEIFLSVFYVVQNQIGYALLVIVPKDMIEQKSSEIQAVTSTFQIDGFSAAPVASNQPSKQTKKIGGGLSGMIGSTGNQQQTKPNDTHHHGQVVGTYNRQITPKDKVHYHKITIKADGTYKEEYKPKNSGNYIGGGSGAWKVKDGILYLTSDGITTEYYVEPGGYLSRKGVLNDNGTSIMFSKEY